MESSSRQFRNNSPNLRNDQLKYLEFRYISSRYNDTSPIAESLLLDHGEVALPALSLTAVVVAHGSRHLLVVHLLRPVGLHLTPRPGELQGVGHL